MKPIYSTFVLIALTFFAQDTFALRSCDLAVSINPIHADSLYQKDQDVQFNVVIKNQGPDTIFPTDTFYLTQSHEYAEDGPMEFKYATAVILPPGDSTSIETEIRLNPTKELQYLQVMILVLAGGPPPFAGKDFLERETSETMQDNAGTYRIAMLSNSSAHDIFKHKIEVYPNPNTNRNLLVKTSDLAHTMTKLYSLNGEYIETSRSMRHDCISLDLSHIQVGTYILYIKTEQTISMEKVIVL